MVSANKINANLGGAVLKQPRSSNMELYRIFCMLMIVAHHYVVNSGVMAATGPIGENPHAANSLFMMLFGAWGKTGINCFLMITGYFMCKSEITLRKFVKLFLQIFFYSIVIFVIFLLLGYERITPIRLAQLLPVWDIETNFVSCFVVFYLTIPFWTILVQHMNKRQHELLLALLLACYTFMGSVPKFNISFNYVTWFGIIYLLASYIRLYPSPIFEKKRLWCWMTIASVVLACLSILVMNLLVAQGRYIFVSDSNKIFAVLIAFCSFLWFKNMDIKYSKTINAFGAATFGVLLIHANSNAMRQWLWKDTVDVIGHYQTLTTGELMLFSAGVVLAIFIICNLIDQLRIATLEKWFFRWYDNKLSAKADALIARIKQ